MQRQKVCARSNHCNGCRTKWRQVRETKTSELKTEQLAESKGGKKTESALEARGQSTAQEIRTEQTQGKTLQFRTEVVRMGRHVRFLLCQCLPSLITGWQPVNSSNSFQWGNYSTHPFKSEIEWLVWTSFQKHPSGPGCQWWMWTRRKAKCAVLSLLGRHHRVW